MSTFNSLVSLTTRKSTDKARNEPDSSLLYRRSLTLKLLPTMTGIEVKQQDRTGYTDTSTHI